MWTTREFEGQNMISEGTILPLHDDPLDARPSYEELQEPRQAEAQPHRVRAQSARGGREGAAVPAVVRVVLV